MAATGPATKTIVDSFGFAWTHLRLGRGSNPGLVRAAQCDGTALSRNGPTAWRRVRADPHCLSRDPCSRWVVKVSVPLEELTLCVRGGCGHRVADETGSEG